MVFRGDRGTQPCCRLAGCLWPVPDDSTYGGGIYIRAVYRKECRGDIMNMDPPLLLQRDGVPWEHGVRQNHCIEISCGAQ